MSGGDGTEGGHVGPRGKQSGEGRMTETDMGEGVDTKPISWSYV